MTQPASQPSRPTDNAFIVQVQPRDTAKHQLGDVIVGALGLTGALVLGAIVAGMSLAGIWIVWRKYRRPFDTNAPPTLGSVPISTSRETQLDQRSDR